MKDSKLLPVALIHVRGSGVRGSTRMQKLVFLGQQEYHAPEMFEYAPGPFGPYSWELERTLEQLEGKDLIQIETGDNEVGNATHFYSLTPGGLQLAQKMSDREALRPYLDIAVELTDAFGEWRIGQLLEYVYDRYETYTVDSELDIDRLSNQNARSQFLEPGNEYGESQYMGPGPEEGLELRTPAEEFFSVN